MHTHRALYYPAILLLDRYVRETCTCAQGDMHKNVYGSPVIAKTNKKQTKKQTSKHLNTHQQQVEIVVYLHNGILYSSEKQMI